LNYPLKLIAKNAGVNGSVVVEKVFFFQFLATFQYTIEELLKLMAFWTDNQVLASDDYKFGYNAATGKYEDLMAAGIIDPTKVLPISLSS
jgi:chaperonin GroEL